MSMFTLSISRVTTSNLPCFMDIAFQVPMQYCSLQHQTLLSSPVTSPMCVIFALAPSLILSGVISPLISSSILGTYWPGEFIFQCPIFLCFHTVLGVLGKNIQGKNIEVVCHSLLQCTTFWRYNAWQFSKIVAKPQSSINIQFRMTMNPNK